MKDKNQNQIGDTNKKVRSIEWLIKEISSILGPIETKFMQDILLMGAMKQAKKMHKDEMIEAMNKAQIIDDVDFDGNVTFIFNNIEQYYNDTFGS